MPAPRQPKAVPQQRRKQLQWKPHEVYALPLHSEESAKLGLHGEYALIYIQGPSSVYDGYHNPRVWLKITKNCYLPKNSEEFNQLDFQRIACTPYANRFSPFSREDDCRWISGKPIRPTSGECYRSLRWSLYRRQDITHQTHSSF